MGLRGANFGSLCLGIVADCRRSPSRFDWRHDCSNDGIIGDKRHGLDGSDKAISGLILHLFMLLLDLYGIPKEKK
jgi:hypothetical protein